MTVAELIEKLKKYPEDAVLAVRLARPEGDAKMIMVAEGHELDPVFQFYKPTVSGFRPMDEKEKVGAAAQG
jgi:hypothetical protein